MIRMQQIYLLPTALVGKGKAINSDRLFIRLFSFYLSNRLTFELKFVCGDHDYSSPGIKIKS